MSQKQRMKKLKRKQRLARRNSTSKQPETSQSESTRQLWCPRCQTYHAAAPPDLEEERQMEEFAAAYRNQYSWEELVRRHGEEGAAIIADCL